MSLTFEQVQYMGHTEITARWEEVQAALAVGPSSTLAPTGEYSPPAPAEPPTLAADLRAEKYGAPIVSAPVPPAARQQKPRGELTDG